VNILSILRPRTIAAVALALIVGSSAYGFAAANTVPDTKAGDGAGAVSGYTASSVTYVLEVADPSKVSTVSFTLDAAASQVQVQLVTGGTWYEADNGGSGNVWTVDPAAGTVTVDDVDTLRVVATS
jgi:hypothetical protein